MHRTARITPRLASAVAALAVAAIAASASAQLDYDEIGTDWCYNTSQPRTLLSTGRALLLWQADGNLVLYDRLACADPAAGAGCGPAAALWASGTHWQGDWLCFWPDGNLGILGQQSQWLFSSGTEGYAFRTHNGHYLRAEGGGGGGLRADVPHNSLHERFDLIDNADGTVALRTHTNMHYVVAEDHGGANANRAAIGPWEKVYVENNNDDTVSIRSVAWDRYLRAEGGGGGDARFDVAHNQAHERYTMIVADTLVLDGCTLSIRNAEGSLWQVGDCATTGTDAGMQHHIEEGAGFGNGNFGAGYNFGMGYQTPFEGYTRAFAEGSVYGRIFGRQLDIVAADAEAVTFDGAHGADASFEVLGIDIPVELPGAEADLFAPIERTFFTAQSTFMAGPFPLTVSGDVTGTIGMLGEAAFGATGAEVTVTPYLDLTAGASVGLGAGCVSAGVNGEVNLIDLSAPLTAALDVIAEQVELVGELVITSLSGAIGLYAEACGIGADWELVSWPAAAEVTLPLLDAVFAYGDGAPGGECPIGSFDGANCLVAMAPAGTQPFMHAGGLYTTPLRQPTCPLGSFDGANCFVAPIPAGASPFTYAGHMYVTPLSGDQCPVGSFDGANCYVGTPPAGTSPFTYAGGWYTTPAQAATCPIGSFDGANCFVAMPAAGTDPFIHAGGLYTTPY